MIIKLEELKENCGKILTAVDNSDASLVTETLSLKTFDNILCLAVTNREYFVEVKSTLTGVVEPFNATVDAKLFLKLISQITTESVEFSVVENALVIKGNGTYKLPLIFDGESLLELPKIEIKNQTVNMPINSEILQSILQYNSKELLKGAIARPVQKLYYIDEQGAITFTSGACVNKFTLEKPISILLNGKLVKLFKLFKEGDVDFTLGFDAISDDIIQTKVKFETANVCISAILTCDDTLLKSVPVEGIRSRADANYPHQVSLNKNDVLSAINRLLLFTTTNSREILKPYSKFEFNKNSVTIWDARKENFEVVGYDGSELSEDYEAILDLTDLKTTIETCVESHFILKFGDNTAITINRGNIVNIIPEVKADR